MVDIILLSLIQGITEFLPISSSSHLIIFSQYLEFNNKNLEIDVSLHIGSFLAVVVFFRKDILNFVQNKDLFLKILIGSFPVMVAGYILIKFNLIDEIRNIKVIGWTTLIFGILLYLSDRSSVRNKLNSNFTLKSSLLIGFLQILSLVPGDSRSGITITAGRFINFNRLESSKISFYLSIPALAGASVLTLKDVFQQNYQLNIFVLISIILSFFFSYFTIKFFLIYVQKFNLNIFVYYRIFLSFLLFVIIYN